MAAASISSSMGIFDYVTYKYVVLKDRRLGVAYYLLAVLILLFILTEVFVRKGYLQYDTSPEGVVKVVLSEELSTGDSSDYSQLAYCWQNSTKSSDVFCKRDDPLNLNWPVEGRAVTITTFAKDKYQRSPPFDDPESDEYEEFKTLQYYTMGPENVLIKVDHAVVASLFTDSRGISRLSGSKRVMKGYLIDQSGRTIRELSEPGKSDKISLQELLEASGISSLDMPSDSYSAKGQNIRQRGGIVKVSIYYQNWYNTWIGTNDIEYFYRVRFIPQMDYNIKQVLPYYNQTPTTTHTASTTAHTMKEINWRIMRKRYAIRVEFEQHGSLGMFSFSTLLFKLASGMGLLALTATIIDTFALYLLPNKSTYREYVYEPSAEIHTKKKKQQ